MNDVICIKDPWNPEFNGPRRREKLEPVTVVYESGKSYYRFTDYSDEYDTRCFVMLSDKTIEQILEETAATFETV